MIISRSARALPLAMYISGDVEGVRRRAEQPPLREPDGVEPVLPSPAVGEWDLGHAFSREHVTPILQN
jgi:hypothetical protein